MRFAVLALLAYLGQSAQPQDHPAQPPDFETLGAQAFRTGYPLVQMAAWRDNYLRAGGSLNHFSHGREILSAFAGESFPNEDLLTSTAWVELSAGPVTLQIPALGRRYMTLQFIGAWTGTFNILSGKDLDGQAVTLYLTPPDWQGAIPAGCRQISCPTSLVSVWLRLFVEAEGDVPVVRGLQRQFIFSGTASPRRSFAGYLDTLGALLPANPPPAPLLATFQRLEPLGLSLRTGFDPGVLTAEARRSAEGAINLSRQDLPSKPPRKPRRLENGWAIYDAGPAMPATLDDRIVLARSGPDAFAALPATEFVYAVGYADSNGEPLQGNRRYVVMLNAGAMPPVDGFWSLSVYTASGRTVYGARHSVHSSSPYLNKTASGGVRITLGPSVPLAEQSNWLPLQPGEGVRLMLRLYQPRRAAVDGTWRLPLIVPASQERR